MSDQQHGRSYIIAQNVAASSTREILKIVFAVNILLAVGLPTAAQKGWSIAGMKSEKKIDILFNGKLMTSYCYYDSAMKPVLFPINTVSGITITRGWPLAPRKGDHTDHRHHMGLWMNYESVNGFDFWNNSTAIPFDKRKLYGTIVYKELQSSSASERQAVLVALSEWKTPNGDILLDERTSFFFKRTPSEFIIDREATLTARSEDINFKDVKDGFLGLRVASELEQPSAEPLEYLDEHGNITTVHANAEKASGLYTSGNGLTGDAVWGTRANWTTLQGTKEGKIISITIIDHHSNPGYPTYWHARGYGLFAANPLGQYVFSKGKERLGLGIGANRSVTFKYRIVIAEGKTDSNRIDELMSEFNRE